MSIQHHLDDATIMRYASGDLDEAFAIVVASHIAMCADCRRAVRLAEAVGGADLLETETSDLNGGAFDRLMLMVDATPVATVERERPTEAIKADSSEVPLPLCRHVGRKFDEIRWKTVVPGIQRCRIDLVPTDSALYMLRINPGRKMPEHGHGGEEMTLVLKGSYRDEFGRFAAGDVADLDHHVEHQPRVDSPEPCICLIATETKARFKGRIGRLLQPLIGI